LRNVPRSIFGSKGKEDGENYSARSFCSADIITTASKSRRMEWTRHCTLRIHEKCAKILTESVKERDHLLDLGMHGNTVLKWILWKQR
jgi:hypothetical protein